VIATQGRSLWILDNISSLHQLTSQSKSTEFTLFKPRDGYRTRANSTILGPMAEYYLPAAPAEALTVEILDSKGTVVNSYNSETAAPRGGRGPGAGMPGVGTAGPESQPEDPDAPAGRRFTLPPRVTKVAGMNRFTWDVRNRAGVNMPPGQYQVRIKFGSSMQTQPLNVLIDPRIAADGVTVADLQEQFEHNTRMRELVTASNQLISRVREAQNILRTGPNAEPAKLQQLNAIAGKLLNEPVRYGKPGLQAHITYLASMTANVDQKIGRDAIERYDVLNKEYAAIKAEVDRLLGAVPTTTEGRQIN
jgi:hypothetical protein